MSSVSGRYSNTALNSLDSLDSSKPTHAMSSTAADSRHPQPYGSIDTMSRRYIVGAPDSFAQPCHDSHPSMQAPYQQTHRLPPLTGLVAGEPCPPDSFRSPYRDHQPFTGNSQPAQTQRQSQPHSQPHMNTPSARSFQPVPPPPPPPSHSHLYSHTHHLHPHSTAPRLPTETYITYHTSPSNELLAASNSPDLSRSQMQLPSAADDEPEPVIYPVPPRPVPGSGSEPVLVRPPSFRSSSHSSKSSSYNDVTKLDPRSRKAIAPAKRGVVPPPTTSPPVSLPHQAMDTSIASRIPNLLGEERAHALRDIGFKLRMRQQPNAARACGFGDRDRRVIDPPPIVELVVEGSKMTRDEIRAYLRYESYIMNCGIYDEAGTRDASFMPEEYQHQRRLMGSPIATPFMGKDEFDQEGCFFCFSDLSCRTPGSFRLKFTLMMIDPSKAGQIKKFPILADIMSEPFKVYSAKEFPGMVASSSLAKRLKEQGCIISIKKGKDDKAKNSRSRDELSDDDDDRDDGLQGPPRKQSRKG